MPDHYSLEVFRRRHFDYGDGEHVGFYGPTQQAGKSTLMFALLEMVASPARPPIVMCMKHKDRVIAHWTKRLGFRETPAWPPPPKLGELPPFGHRPPGYTLWPHQSLVNPEADNALLESQFRRAIIHNRKHTPSISVMNELYGMLAELHLRQLLTAVITRDSIAGHGGWHEAQKPSGTQGISIPGFFFNSDEHMFFARDGEGRNRERYAQIACGIDAREIERETLALDTYSWLYIRRTSGKRNPRGGAQWCVVDAYDPAFAV